MKTKLKNGHKICSWALDAKGNRIPWKEPLSVPVAFTCSNIQENYCRARFPSTTPEGVKPLDGGIHILLAELESIEKWYAEHKSEIK